MKIDDLIKAGAHIEECSTPFDSAQVRIEQSPSNQTPSPGQLGQDVSDLASYSFISDDESFLNTPPYVSNN